MSDQVDRVATRTGGNANLVKNKGEMIVGDGEQAVYLNTTGAADGDALVVDSSKPEGLGFAAVSGGTLVFQDGVTKTGSVVTNDLVTGTPVAQFDAEVPVGSDASSVNVQPGGDILLRAGDDGTGRHNVTAIGGNITLSAQNTVGATLTLTSAAGPVDIDASGNLTMTAGAGNVASLSGGGVSISAVTNSLGASAVTTADVTAGTNLSLTATAGQLHAQAGGGMLLETNGNTALAINTNGGGNVDVTTPDGGHVHVSTSGGSGNDIRLESDSGASRILMSGGGSAQHQIEIRALGTGADGRVVLNGTSRTTIDGGTVGTVSTGVLITAHEGPVTITAEDTGVGAGNVTVTANQALNLTSNTGDTTVAAATAGAGGLILNAGSTGGNATVNTQGTGDFVANVSHDETHVIGRNLSMTAAGSGGISLVATVGNATLSAGDTDGSGELRFSPTAGAPGATRTVRFFDGAGTPQGTVTSPGGGTVVDVECRAQLSALLSFFFNMGLLTDPNP